MPHVADFRIPATDLRVYRDMRFLLALGLALGSAAAQDQPAYTFGTTVVELSALEGRVYFLPKSTKKLPDFSHMSPAGTLYTTMLNVWPQEFSEGFPNIRDRFE